MATRIPCKVIQSSFALGFLFASFVCATQAQAPDDHTLPIDVVNYKAEIEPDIAGKSLKGTVEITYRPQHDKLASVRLDCGELTIDGVVEDGKPLKFFKQERQLHIDLSRPGHRGERRKLTVTYSGTPRRGIRFFPEQNQVYTIFSTSQWLVCIDAPEDKATFSLALILPANLTAVGNGRLVSQRQIDGGRFKYSWEQNSPIPTYIFGFAAGPFRAVTETSNGVVFKYLGTSFSDSEMKQIFRDSPDMLQFYQDRAGVRYADRTYTQVLPAGNAEQEMSSFTALNEAYARRVLANERELWLGAHEFAHQWWGNMVTCRDWNHFWLNEGIANFMTAAYIEHRFGKDAYMHEIESYRESYEKVRDAGKDKSLVFPDWLHPTAQDRTLVYDKGAYVLHVLRSEIGEDAFWKGIKLFTRSYFGKSVVTLDFQSAMEQASGRKLQSFFDQWIYLKH